MKPLVLFLTLVFASPLMAQEVFDTDDPFDEEMKTGIAVGESIPSFRAIDQNGKSWDFENIKGPNGAVLVFFRSADW